MPCLIAKVFQEKKKNKKDKAVHNTLQRIWPHQRIGQQKEGMSPKGKTHQHFCWDITTVLGLLLLRDSKPTKTGLFKAQLSYNPRSV